MFRCEACGKWSHAQRMPKTHQRWVYEGEPDYDESLNENASGSYDHINGFAEAPNAHPVACGPFVPYIAVPEEREGS